MKVPGLKFKIPSRRHWLLLAVALFTAVCVQGQGAFQNLNFEAANVSGYPVGANDVPITAALPGWSAFYTSAGFGTTQVNQVWYDAISGGGQIISVNDINTGGGFTPLAGNYSAALFGGINNTDSTISQSGLVPGYAKSLRLDAAYSLLPFTVALNGQNLSVVPLANAGAYTIYGVDVSGYAGQSVTLSIREPGPAVGPNASSLFLDNILFSNQSIPEPATWALLVCGAGLLGLARRQRKA